VTASTASDCTSVRFADTNVLLYAISRDPAEQEKADRANEILGAGDVGLSVQVLQEFYAGKASDQLCGAQPSDRSHVAAIASSRSSSK
jgi:predicted nucleic acid-binding protein